MKLLYFIFQYLNYNIKYIYIYMRARVCVCVCDFSFPSFLTVFHANVKEPRQFSFWIWTPVSECISNEIMLYHIRPPSVSSDSLSLSWYIYIYIYVCVCVCVCVCVYVCLWV